MGLAGQAGGGFAGAALPSGVVSAINLTSPGVPDMQVQPCDEQFHLVLPGTDHPISKTRYRITASTGEVFEGVTDMHGYTERIFTDKAATLEIEVFDNDEEQVVGDI